MAGRDRADGVEGAVQVAGSADDVRHDTRVGEAHPAFQSIENGEGGDLAAGAEIELHEEPRACRLAVAARGLVAPSTQGFLRLLGEFDPRVTADEQVDELPARIDVDDHLGTAA